MRPKPGAGWRCYVIAMVGIFLATAVRLTIAPYVDDLFILPMYFLAVLLTGWYCGLGPALSSLVLGIATASLLILPEGSFGDKGLVSTLFGLGLYIAVGAVGIAVSEDHRKVQRSCWTRSTGGARPSGRFANTPACSTRPPSWSAT